MLALPLHDPSLCTVSVPFHGSSGLCTVPAPPGPLPLLASPQLCPSLGPHRLHEHTPLLWPTWPLQGLCSGGEPASSGGFPLDRAWGERDGPQVSRGGTGTPCGLGNGTPEMDGAVLGYRVLGGRYVTSFVSWGAEDREVTRRKALTVGAGMGVR